MDPSFSDSEKRFVLAEMLKASQLDVGVLVDLIRNYNVQPDWFSMQLPGGRNMNQCIRAAENMFNIKIQPPPVPPIAPLKRKSLGDIMESASKRPAIMPTIESQALSQPQPQPQHMPLPRNVNVNIQPRPSPNGHTGTPVPAMQSMSASPAGGTGRKRGRPSKADKEAAARANAAVGGYAPITPIPLAPQPAPSIPQQQLLHDPSGSSHAAYHISSGEARGKKKGRVSSNEKMRPRALAENPLEQVEIIPTSGDITRREPTESFKSPYSPASIEKQSSSTSTPIASSREVQPEASASASASLPPQSLGRDIDSKRPSVTTQT